jgi:hypothetical protein
MRVLPTRSVVSLLLHEITLTYRRSMLELLRGTPNKSGN